MVPLYVSDLFDWFTPVGRQLSLRSAQADSVNKLVVPRRAGRAGYLDRALCVAGPLAWNRLPNDLRVVGGIDAFKRGLKTFLFRRCYGD